MGRAVAIQKRLKMSMRTDKRDKWLVKACILAMIAPASAMAVPVFDNWSADNGTITPDTGPGSYCGSAGVTCTTLVSGNGFLQQEIQDNNDGATYIQTIITDTDAGSTGGTPAASLPYSDESFIRRNQTSGIMSQQRSSEASGTFNFSTTSELYTGWANGTGFKPAGKGNTNITQGFTDTGTAVGDEFINKFDLRIDTDPQTSEVTGKTMSLRQDVGMGDGVVDNTTDVQSFLVEQRTGTLLTSGGTLTLDATSATNGGTVTWVAGDDVMVSWIGQAVNTASPGTTPDISKFGFQGVTRVDQSPTPVTTTISTFSTSQVDIVSDGGGGYVSPYDWDTLFGTAPTLPSLPIPTTP